MELWVTSETRFVEICVVADIFSSYAYIIARIKIILIFTLWWQGCISVRMLFHQTSFCFVCSHLASGQKEGDEQRRNIDVMEILKNTQFPKICKSRLPEKILDHEWAFLKLVSIELVFYFSMNSFNNFPYFGVSFTTWKNGFSRVIWLGDLNYRIALSYHEAEKLVQKKAWDALLDKDQVIDFTIQQEILIWSLDNI